MTDNKFRYGSDENGDRVLIGLTLAETIEFERLDALRRGANSELAADLAANGFPSMSAQRRWLDLFEKHELARSALLEAQKATKH